ncbi:HesB/IscA family protein [Shivajiella indica]|uniref:HesB/IscA family protein n=1 Tax=Shivajiella indica TaxID=872115 RepID=A0ABW5BCN0_9BACT
MIVVTEKAKDRIIQLKKEEGRTENENIRVSVKGGGCSGLMYDLDFDAKVVESDHVFEDKGIKIIVDRKSLLYLAGTTLEFSDGLNGKGFQFVNPNASRTCGCGESFSV